MDKMSFRIQRLVGLCHVVIVFLIGSHVYDFFCNYRIGRIVMVDLAVWRLDKAILVNPCIGGKGVDKTDVRAFRRLDRAHSSIMRIMYVTRLESGPVS